MAESRRNLPQNSIYQLAEKYPTINKYTAAEIEAMQTRLKDVGYPDITAGQLVEAVDHFAEEGMAMSGSSSDEKKWNKYHRAYLKNHRLHEAYNAYFKNRESERGDGNWKWYQGENLKGILTAVGILTAAFAAPALIASAPAAASAAAAPSSGGVLSSISAGVQSAYTAVSGAVSTTYTAVSGAVSTATGAVSSLTKAVESSEVAAKGKEAVDLYKKGEAVFTTVKALTAKGPDAQGMAADQVSEPSGSVNENMWVPVLAGVVLFAIIIGGRK